MIRFKTDPDTEKSLRQLLHSSVHQWFFSSFQGFSLPQLYSVMEVHKRQNLLVSAPTGSGKTLSVFLAILNELVDSAEKGILEDKVYAVYCSPLKALSRDIQKNLIEPLEKIKELSGKDYALRVMLRTGDTTQKEKTSMLKKPPHILVTTPESLALLLASPKFREHLTRVDYAIIDEIHSLAENKRGVHLSLSLERLQFLSPGLCRIGLSATISPLEEIAQFLVGTERDCEIVDVRFLKDLDLEVLSPVPDLINVSYERISFETYNLLDKLIQEHKTTLIFTNTRSATERVVHHLKDRFPKKYIELNEVGEAEGSLIGAHHGSLSKEHRHSMEDKLRQGKMKAIVCSTSLELGIDIGYIDLVICLGSPKSVARLLQRTGRSGHKLHSTIKGKIVVLDRDDLVECSVLAKCAKEGKIDRIHIPTHCLDVLAQQINGFVLEQAWNTTDLFRLIRQAYCYKDLRLEDYEELLSYLAGEFTDLEERSIYAKIWRDGDMIGKKGKMNRVIYMTNLGTIPDSSFVTVKIGEQIIGSLDEGFLEKLKRGDIFVLGGNTYEFLFGRGMVAQVRAAPGKRPTIPSWFSEMLPLSFDLAMEIQHFRWLMQDKFVHKVDKKEILSFLSSYLYLDGDAAEALYSYFFEQYSYLRIPHKKELLIEHYTDEDGDVYTLFHSVYGRRVNDILSRALGYVIGKIDHRDTEVSITDNGFLIRSEKKIRPKRALELLKAHELKTLMDMAIEKSEVLKRRFRHCANRAFMILRTYKGRRKNVGRQQVSSMILMSAVKRISPDFVILKEARREVLEDLMDLESALKIVKDLEEGNIHVKEVDTSIPSPFALNLLLQGHSDIIKIEEKQEFLQRMHSLVMAKIGLKK